MLQDGPVYSVRNCRKTWKLVERCRRTAGRLLLPSCDVFGWIGFIFCSFWWRCSFGTKLENDSLQQARHLPNSSNVFFCEFLIVDFVGRFFQCWSRERGNTMFFQICHEMSGTWQLPIEWGETVRLTPNVWEDCRNRGHKKPIPAAKGWHSSWPCWAFAR